MQLVQSSLQFQGYKVNKLLFEENTDCTTSKYNVCPQFLNEIIERFSLNTIGAFTYCDNIPSIRVLEKNGFMKMEEFTEAGKLSAYFQRTCTE